MRHHVVFIGLVVAIFLASILVACGGPAPTIKATPTPASPTATVAAGMEVPYWLLPADKVADYEEIRAAGPTVVEAKPNSVTLEWRTKVNTLCTISFGPTEDYGEISPPTEIAMVGGPHRDHNHVIDGLQPDTLYHFRIDAIGPDGTVYRTRDLTFRTSP